MFRVHLLRVTLSCLLSRVFLSDRLSTLRYYTVQRDRRHFMGITFRITVSVCDVVGLVCYIGLNVVEYFRLFTHLRVFDTAYRPVCAVCPGNDQGYECTDRERGQFHVSRSFLCNCVASDQRHTKEIHFRRKRNLIIKYQINYLCTEGHNGCTDRS